MARAVRNGNSVSFVLDEEEEKIYQQVQAEAAANTDVSSLMTETKNQYNRIYQNANSDQYADRDARIGLQKDLYSYEANLRRLNALGYDMSDAISGVPEIQKAVSARTRLFTQFDDEADYNGWKKFGQMSDAEQAKAYDSLQKEAGFYALHGDTKKQSEIETDLKWLRRRGGNGVQASIRLQGYRDNQARIADAQKQMEALQRRIDDIENDDTFGAYHPEYNDLKKQRDELQKQIEAMQAEVNRYVYGHAYQDEEGNDHWISLTQDEAYQLSLKPDFESVSANRDFNNPTQEQLQSYDSNYANNSARISDTLTAGGYYDEEGNLHDITGAIVPIQTDESPVNDKLGIYLSAGEEGRTEAYNILSASNGNSQNTWANIVQEGDANGWGELTDTEIAIYYYLLNEVNQESAYKYLEDMTTELTYRETKKRADAIDEADGLEKLAYNIASVPASVFGGIPAFIEDTARSIQGKNINPYSRAHALQNSASAIRESTAQDINDATGNASVLGITLGDVYQAGMSSIDSVVGALTLGGLGYGAAMGTGAASSEAKELFERGASREQIMWGSALAGAAEGLFEKVSIDHFLKLKSAKNIGQAVKNFLLQGAVEGSEEANTEIANTITDALVMGSQSEFQLSIQKYLDEGKTQAEAEALALLDVGKNVWKAGVGGFISGAGMGGASSIYSYAGYQSDMLNQGQQIMDSGQYDAVKALALDMAQNSAYGKSGEKLGKYASKVDAKINQANELRGSDVMKDATRMAGKLYDRADTLRQQQNTADIQSALQDKGLGKREAKKAAEVIGAAIESGDFSSKEIQGLMSRQEVSDAVDEILSDEKSGINRRNANHNLAMLGYKLNDEGKVVPLVNSSEDNSSTEDNASSETGNRNSYLENPDGRILDASTEGKTIIAETGEEVKIKEIASIKNGEMTLRLEDGRTVSAKDVEYASVDEALVYESLLRLGTNAAAANTILNTWNQSGDLSVEAFVLGVEEAYRYGQGNFSIDEMMSNGSFVSDLTEEQRNTAHKLGNMFSNSRVEAAQKNVDELYEQAKSALGNAEEKTDASYGAVLDDGITPLSLTESQRESYKMADQIAQAAKVNIRVYAGKTTEFGYYNSNTDEIWLNLNAVNMSHKSMMAFTLGHELVHRAKKGSPAKYKAFADFLVKEYVKQGSSVEAMIQQELDAARQFDKSMPEDKRINMTEGGAFEEVVCDACQRMLLDTNAGQKLAEFAAQSNQNRSFLEDLKRWIKEFIDKLRTIFSGVDPDSIAAKEFAKFDENVKQILADMYVDMTIDAGEKLSTITRSLGKGSVLETNESGDFTIAKSKDSSKIVYNVVTWENGGRATLEVTLRREGYSQDDINAALTIMDANHKLVKRIANEVDGNGNLAFPEQGRINEATIATDIKDGHAVLSALVTNGDYPVNIDLLMVCKKRKAYQRVINRLCETGLIQQATLDSLAIAEINKILGKYGFETACLGCFVESRRLRIQEWANTICNEWNAEVKKHNKDAKPFGFFKGESNLTDEEVMQLVGELESGGEKNDQGNLNLGRGSSVKRMGVLLDKVPSLRKTLSVEDLITPDGLTRLRKFDSNLFSIVKSRYGSNSPKFVQEFNPYNHELARYGKVPEQYKSLREYLYAIGGARMQSFSDFLVENWFDYCQIVADLAARKLPMHTYTKEIAMVKLFGMTGIKVNMSLIPDIDRSMGKEYAGLTRNENGELELIFADKDRFKSTGGKSYMQSINFADAIEIQNDPRYSANVGTIAIGVSDIQIRMMLNDSRIRMVIPYHSSGMNPIFADLMGTAFYNDYTDVQNTTVKQLYDKNGRAVKIKLTKTQSGKLTSGFQFNEVLQELGDARAAADAYKEWCADRSKHTITIKGETYTAELTPKFNDFSDEVNYYKLLEDFNAYDCITEEAAQQGDVQQIYPEGFEEILRDELSRQERHRKNQAGNDSFNKAMSEIEDYLNNHSKADTLFYAQNRGIKLGKKDTKLSASENEKLKNLKSGKKSFSLPKASTSQASTDKAYMDAVERGDMETAQRMVNERAEQLRADVFAQTDVPTYRIRRGHTPKKTIKVYKVFTMSSSGKPSALFVSSNYDLPVGVWLDAQDTYHFTDHRNGHMYVPSTKNPNTKGGATGRQTNVSDISADDIAELEKRGYLKRDKNGNLPKSITSLAYRPGWHAGDLPFFPQGGMQLDGSNYPNVHRYNQVVFECEMIADNDYTNYHVTDDGKVHLHDMQKMPENGSYKYSTNPMAKSSDIGAWYIGSSIKIVRALTQEECDRILQDKGRPAQEWQAYQDADELKRLKADARSKYTDKKSRDDAAKAAEYAYEHRYGTLDLDALGYDPNQTDGGKKLLDAVTYDDNGNVIPLSERFNDKKDDIRYSLPKGFASPSYDEIVAKDPISVVDIGRNEDGLSYAELKDMVLKNAHEKKVFDSPHLNRDTGVSIFLTPKSFTHAFSNLTAAFGEDTILAMDHITDIIHEAILTHIDQPKNTAKEEKRVFTLFSAIDGANGVEPIKLKVKEYSKLDMPRLPENIRKYFEENGVPETHNRLYDAVALEVIAVEGAKKESGASASGTNRNTRLVAKGTPNSTIKIADLFRLVNGDARKYIPIPTESNSHKLPVGEDTSNRSLLANALESAAQNETERVRLAEYRGKIDMLNAEEQKLSELRAEIKDLSFAKGTKDTKRIKELQFEANQTANRINTIDKQILRIEATKPIQNVLQREKKLAYKRAEQKGKEALAAYRERAVNKQREIIDRYQESRAKGVESRRKTAMRHKIQNVVNELNQYLLKGNKEKHVMIGMQKAVAEALDAINMDTVGAEERIAKLTQEMMKAKSPEKIQEIARKIASIQERGDNMKIRLESLKSAYAEIKNSDDPMIANAHDGVIERKLESVIESVGDTSLRDMTLDQLEDVYDMYKMVLTNIRNANKAFKASKSQDIAVLGNNVMMEVETAGGKRQYRLAGTDGISNFNWNNLKPVYAFERIGSKTFSELFNNVRSGEDTWAKDITEAKEFSDSMKKKYGYNKWNFEKQYHFKSSAGVDFSLTLDQIMSLYAYSKRKQADEHLEKGGFVYDSNVEVVEKKHGIPVKYKVNIATAHNLSKEILAEITGILMRPENQNQKAFVDEMQSYLSTTMGDKGNEVSLEMYGIKLFKEKAYFPLKSAKQFLFEQNEIAEEVRVKNSGFTKEVKPHANNPIILTGFMDAWANHVNDMSMYHAFVLPLEDFNRVFNYNTPRAGSQNKNSVKEFIQNAYGPQAVNYVSQLLKDLNGGARRDPRESAGKALVGRFKKAAVFASASVVIQQPSAVGRALALINPKYFDFNPKLIQHKKLWAEVKKYAPVAIIKEMGYFDTDMGMSTVDYIKGDKSIMDKADEWLSKAPALADELTWCHIWTAVKRETLAKNKGMDIKSDEFLQKVGKRFTEVIVKTQVYDSVLSRSANMRSKNLYMNMITSFMAEPTTSFNMLQSAAWDLKRGYKGKAAQTFGSVMASVVLNALLVSLVYAARDDDEDETWMEKYFSSLATELVEGVNPITYIPIAKDIWSLLQGYDVERSDMTLFSAVTKSLTNLVRAVSVDTSDMDEDALEEHGKQVTDAAWGLVDAVMSMTGIPVKNVRRDVMAAINTYKTVNNGLSNNKTSFWNEIAESVKKSLPVWGWFPDEKKSDKLYEAIISGDKAYQDRIESLYDSQNAIDSARVKALRDNDPRILEAATAAFNGDPGERVRIAREIIAEGRFSQDDIIRAINAEITKLERAANGESESEKSSPKLYDMNDYYDAIMIGDKATADDVKGYYLDERIAQGYSEEDALNSFESSFTSTIKSEYLDGNIGKDKVMSILTTYGGSSESEAETSIKKWDFEDKYGYSWDQRDNAYRLGDITMDELVDYTVAIEGDAESAAKFLFDEQEIDAGTAADMLVTYSGMELDDAENKVAKWGFKNAYGYSYDDRREAYISGAISASDLKKYLMDLGGMTSDEADEKIAVYDWRKRNPGTDLDDNDIAAYISPIEDIGLSIEESGVSPEAFAEYRDQASKCKGVDSDGDGKIDSGSKKAQILLVINSLPVSAEQKTALYFLNGWAASRLYEAPWY